MLTLWIVLIILGSIFTYTIIGAIIYGLSCKGFKIPMDRGSNQIGTNDRTDMGIWAALWPCFILLYAPWLFANYVGKRIATSTKKVKSSPDRKVKSSSEPVTCDLCRTKLEKGPHR